MNAIVNINPCWGIGSENQLLIHIRADMRHFRSMTVNNTVIFGRKTLDTFPNGDPLPKRSNIVLTRDPSFCRDGLTICHNLTELQSAIAGLDPDSVFVFTTNMDYKGCKSLQQSVLSRCNIKREIKTPTAEVMAERALAQMKTPKKFGAPKFKKRLVEKMAHVCKEIASYSKDHDISDGVCGVRELNDWTKKALLLAKADFSEEVTEKHVVYAAWVTILEKCSQNPEEMEEIVTAVFQKTFSQEDVELGRELYYAGEL